MSYPATQKVNDQTKLSCAWAEKYKVDRLPSAIPISIIIVVGMIMGVGAAVLGYPLWAVPVISLLGMAGAFVAALIFA